MNYDKLVKALRCENTGDDECGSSDCPYWSGLGCMDGQLMKDAAAAIEALQKRIVSALTALHLANEKMGYYGIQPYTEADGEDMISDWVKTLVHEELKQQLPKRGEWVAMSDVSYKCSVCGETSCCRGNFCSDCGAKMEVQDGE